MQVLFLTDRGRRHQEEARRAAPPELKLTFLRSAGAEVLRDTEVLISERNRPVTASMIELAPKLKLILRLGSLSHDLDLQHAKRRGVRVSVQPARAAVQAAEHVLMMILALSRRLGRSLASMSIESSRPLRKTDEDQFAYNWHGFSDLEPLSEKTVSILGMGEIGIEVARRLRPFGVAKINYHKREPYPEQVEQQHHLIHASAEEAVAAADILVSLLPYSAETVHLISAQLLARLRPSALFVHAGSGGVVDEPALAAALSAKQLAGAALDTYGWEPLSLGSPLVALARDANANVLLTPHVASGNLPDTRREDFAEVLRMIRGEPLVHER